MKVLQVNCVYNKGSTGKIVYDIHTELLKNNEESVVCYGRGAKLKEPNIYKTCGELYSKLNNVWARITGLMYGGLYFSTKKLISVIKKEKPDVVHVHCINGYFVNIYRFMDWLKKSGINTVLTLHAEFMHTANCGHAFDCEKWRTGCGRCPRFKKETRSILFDRTNMSWKKMKAAFDGFDHLSVVSVSPWLKARAETSPILLGKQHSVVLNGVNTEVFKRYDVQDLRNKHGLGNKKVIFYATPNFVTDIHHIKGGYYLIELAERMKNEDAVFIVAGNYPKMLTVPSNVILLGRLTDQTELARYYAMADMTLLTSKRETFSMVTAESLCCGTPVVGFKAGAPEQIALEEYSEFVEFGDLEALEETLRRRMRLSEADADTLAELAKRKYAKSVMLDNYMKIYKTVAASVMV